MIRLATFDWNGTILADTEAIVAAANEIIIEYGGKKIDRRVYQEEFRFPAEEFYNDQGCDPTMLDGPEAPAMFHAAYEYAARNARTRKGARAMLDFLETECIERIILSNHIIPSINAQLERLSLTEKFSEVLAHTDHSVTHIGNTKIAWMQEYLELTGIPASESLIVGDSPEDIGIGKEFGMQTVGIKDGYFSTQRLRAARPDHLIGSLYEIIDIVKEYK